MNWQKTFVLVAIFFCFSKGQTQTRLDSNYVRFMKVSNTVRDSLLEEVRDDIRMTNSVHESQDRVLLTAGLLLTISGGMALAEHIWGQNTTDPQEIKTAQNTLGYPAIGFFFVGGLELWTRLDPQKISDWITGLQ